MRYFLLLLGLLLGACSIGKSQEAEPVSQGPAAETKSFTATLADVTKGMTIAGVVNTKEFATGQATVTTDAAGYSLVATMQKLPELGEEFFYEGWLVSENPKSVVSTGKAKPGEVSGDWVNEFLSVEQYQDPSQYVVTLEPNDGDPAPADHLLEGMLLTTN